MPSGMRTGSRSLVSMSSSSSENHHGSVRNRIYFRKGSASAIALDDVLSILGRARASVVILDACRNDPFEEAAAREKAARGAPTGTISRGLAGVGTEPSGTFIIYSAGVKQLALDRLGDDDPNPNSVFTRVFLDEMVVPGRSIREIVVRTRSRVR